MKRNAGKMIFTFVLFALVGVLSGCLSIMPQTSSYNTSLEGSWYSASSDKYYEIASSGGVCTMNCYTLLRDGTKSVSNFEMLTFERGEKSVETSTSGYLYGYNKNRPGWIAYYYEISGYNVTLTSLLTSGGGVTWNSLNEAKAGADKNYSGTVTLNMTKR